MCPAPVPAQGASANIRAVIGTVVGTAFRNGKREAARTPWVICKPDDRDKKPDRRQVPATPHEPIPNRRMAMMAIRIAKPKTEREGGANRSISLARAARQMATRPRRWGARFAPRAGPGLAACRARPFSLRSKAPDYNAAAEGKYADNDCRPWACEPDGPSHRPGPWPARTPRL